MSLFQTVSLRDRQGFTILELIAVTVIIAILTAILLPTVSRVRDTAKQAKCMGNARELTLALLNAANQNKDQAFPKNVNESNLSSSLWAWDVCHSLANKLSVGRDLFYCPTSATAALYSVDSLWTYYSNPNPASGIAVTSYVLLVPGTPQISSLYVNDRIRSSYEVTEGVTFQIPANRRPLVVDGVISNGSTNFQHITGGLVGNVSNHMVGSKPRGAHAGYVDGHVAWRPFRMATAIDDTSGFRMRNTTPNFWF